MDQNTINTYNELAKEYDEETADFWDRFPRTFLDKFIELARGNVLDVGSGPGRDGLILQNHGLAVTCLDASEKMIALSREKELISVLGDFARLPFPDESFDNIWAYTSLLHVPKSEIEKTLLEIKRVLKPNGYFALGLIEGDTELYLESSGVNQPRWFSFYRKEEIKKLLSTTGFKIAYFESFVPKSKNYLNFIAIKK
jgi:ubiquinone/menaquinone biosynthesis C-methylase UbiE